MVAKQECRSARLCSGGALLVAALAVPAAAQLTSHESVDSSGTPLPGDSLNPAISVDGRYVAFFSYPNWGLSQIYLRDRLGGATELVSVHSNETPGDNYSYTPSLSPDSEAEFVARLIGCDRAQGFHLSRPLPRTAFAVWLARHNEELARLDALETARSHAPAIASHAPPTPSQAPEIAVATPR